MRTRGTDRLAVYSRFSRKSISGWWSSRSDGTPSGQSCSKDGKAASHHGKSLLNDDDSSSNRDGTSLNCHESSWNGRDPYWNCRCSSLNCRNASSSCRSSALQHGNSCLNCGNSSSYRRNTPLNCDNSRAFRETFSSVFSNSNNGLCHFVGDDGRQANSLTDLRCSRKSISNWWSSRNGCSLIPFSNVIPLPTLCR